MRKIYKNIGFYIMFKLLQDKQIKVATILMVHVSIIKESNIKQGLYSVHVLIEIRP